MNDESFQWFPKWVYVHPIEPSDAVPLDLILPSTILKWMVTMKPTTEEGPKKRSIVLKRPRAKAEDAAIYIPYNMELARTRRRVDLLHPCLIEGELSTVLSVPRGLSCFVPCAPSDAMMDVEYSLANDSAIILVCSPQGHHWVVCRVLHANNNNNECSAVVERSDQETDRTLVFGSSEYLELVARRLQFMMFKRAEIVTTGEADFDGDVTVQSLRKLFPPLQFIPESVIDKHVLQRVVTLAGGRIVRVTDGSSIRMSSQSSRTVFAFAKGFFGFTQMKSLADCEAGALRIMKLKANDESLVMAWHLPRLALCLASLMRSNVKDVCSRILSRDMGRELLHAVIKASHALISLRHFNGKIVSQLVEETTPKILSLLEDPQGWSGSTVNTILGALFVILSPNLTNAKPISRHQLHQVVQVFASSIHGTSPTSSLKEEEQIDLTDLFDDDDKDSNNHCTPPIVTDDNIKPKMVLRRNKVSGTLNLITENSEVEALWAKKGTLQRINNRSSQSTKHDSCRCCNATVHSSEACPWFYAHIFKLPALVRLPVGLAEDRKCSGSACALDEDTDDLVLDFPSTGLVSSTEERRPCDVSEASAVVAVSKHKSLRRSNQDRDHVWIDIAKSIFDSKSDYRSLKRYKAKVITAISDLSSSSVASRRDTVEEWCQAITSAAHAIFKDDKLHSAFVDQLKRAVNNTFKDGLDKIFPES